jgi:hypothetical protein
MTCFVRNSSKIVEIFLENSSDFPTEFDVTFSNFQLSNQLPNSKNLLYPSPKHPSNDIIPPQTPSHCTSLGKTTSIDTIEHH